MEIYVDDEAKLTLHGLQQHYVKLKENEKNKKLFELLDVLEFNQVMSSAKLISASRLYYCQFTHQRLSYGGINAAVLICALKFYSSNFMISL